ncbi:hypothetical protein BDN70DRAFT_935941 [Pholiota conissans]|uniref:DUF6534 domain-containing protein n=1 Tax=Pholiota conissans TaxID=109636 RepID=A0A9P5YT63_9AGAR|nr:hypothetical protein BDN70DRAFT_935941 [Pholiota conissans]
MSIFGIFKINLNQSYGAYLIGTFISNILLGITCLQTYTYFRTYKDGFFTKLLVATLLILELLHGALSMHVIYFYLITNFLDPLELFKPNWSIKVTFGVTGLIVLIVHTSYALRIYYVSGKRLLIAIFVAFLSLVNAGLGWSLTIYLFRNPQVTGPEGIPNDIAQAILISSAVADFVIAGTLGYYLNKARSGIKQTDKIIDRLIVYTVNNGLLTSLVDIIALIFVYKFPDALYSVAVSQIIGKMYANSWMATLNSRKQHNAPSTSTRSNEVLSFGVSAFGAASNPEASMQRVSTHGINSETFREDWPGSCIAVGRLGVVLTPNSHHLHPPTLLIASPSELALILHSHLGRSPTPHIPHLSFLAFLSSSILFEEQPGLPGRQAQLPAASSTTL